MSSLTDEELIRRVLAGETEMYAPLVTRYQERLYRHACGMLRDGDAAADVVQDSFVKAYTKLELCQNPARFRAWIFRILRNGCKDYLKSKRRQTVPLDPDAVLAPTRQGPDAVFARQQAGVRVEWALAQLPDAQREAFLLKHVGDLSYEEMAEMADVSVSALKMRVLRARERLQSLLTDIDE